MLKSCIGYGMYLLLPNDIGWALLSETERGTIKLANFQHNNFRPDYADPTKYSGGECFDTPGNRANTLRGQIIQSLLEKNKPRRVIEIGPGSGYYTRQIVMFPSVQEYIAVDVNMHFLDFIKQRIPAIGRSDLSCKFIEADAAVLGEKVSQADLIVLLSAVHHIPDRESLLIHLANCLVSGGAVLAIDPTHYIVRLCRLIIKCFIGGYLKKSFRNKITNLSTHHFCSLEEYRRICRRCQHFTIKNAEFWRKNSRCSRFFSTEMSICLEKL